MKYLHLIWAALFRSKTRTFLTLLSVVAAFLLFGMLDSVRVAFNSSANVEGYDRLITTSKLSITQALPYSLLTQIESTPGVANVSYATWFGGIYQDPNNFFANYAIGPGFMELYPEYVLPPEQLQAFNSERIGAVVGESLAKQFGWKIGDNIPLQATIWPTRGSNDWTFKLVGIFKLADKKRAGEERQMMFHWKYFDEANDFIKGQAHWYVLDLDDASKATQVAKAIDAMSENSDRETKTQTEQAFNQAFFKQIGDIGLIVTAVMSAVFFTLLLLAGNTMAQAVRERIPELAVLKTIGFSNRSVLWLVLMESIVLIVIGGAIGLAIATLLIPAVSAASGGAIQLGTVPPATWLLGLALMVGLGVVVGAQPALRAMRLNIVDALAGR
jgi:putative ABC transport system permease protein